MIFYRKGDMMKRIRAAEAAKREPGKGMIHVFIAERIPVFRFGLEACLSKTPHVRVVGQADEGTKLHEQLDAGRVDVMLMDSELPGLAGFSLLRRVKEARPALSVLLMAATDDVGWLLRGIRAGASGVVAKDAPVGEFHDAIQRIYQGHTYIAESLASKLVGFYQRNEKEPLDERLSPREFEVMQWLSRGLKLSEIARKLGLSHQTITTHRRHILEKTGLRTTAGIIRYSILNGLEGREEKPGMN